tara:strand:- start:2524 stop:3522 length:999 start_codon:yes stop_codon:yes gene_type:complete
MDPLTQGVLGSAVAQQSANKKNIIIATLFGFLSGLAPDLDIFIRSNHDPLLALEYHRQFTHSLIFIPIGGLICALIFYYLFAKRREIEFKSVYLYCTLGYGTHGLLDSCTSYGTQLLWPFSDARISWNTISIIDPIFTLPIFLLILIGALKKKKIYTRISLCWIIGYCIFGVVQKERAKDLASNLALSRGHTNALVDVKPSFANLIVWKSIYSNNNIYYVDAVKVGLRTKIYEGSKINKLNISESFPWLDLSSQQAKDIERFRWFSGGYVALSNKYKNRIIDIRYSMLPNEIKGLWGIELDSLVGSEIHAKYVFNRERNINSIKELFKMIKD